jgi:hypothetical protein
VKKEFAGKRILWKQASCLKNRIAFGKKRRVWAHYLRPV